MSVIVYNNIQLPYGYTTNFLQEAVYDPSNTDRILTKFDISVNCLISSIYASQLNPALGALTANPADFMAWLRTSLLVPKQQLSIRVNGVELIPRSQSTNVGTVDSKNGPLPQHCQIIALNDTLFLVNYRIVAHYWENYSIVPPPPVTSDNTTSSPVLYNRWRESIIIDERNFTKRVRQGRFQIRSDNVEKIIPDQLRTQMAIVGVPTGFLRTRNEYTVTEDGLGMEYVQEDQEVFKVPPSGGFKAEGLTRIMTEKNNKYNVTCQVRLFGDGSFQGGGGTTLGRPLNQQALANKAVSIVMAKLSVIPFNYIQGAQMDINLYDNEVFFVCTVQASNNIRILQTFNQQMLQAGPGSTGGLNVFYDVLNPSDTNFFTTPYSDASFTVVPPPGAIAGKSYSISRDSPPVYLPRGTGGLILEAAAYFDPSITGATVRPQRTNLASIDLTTTPAQVANVPSQWTTTAPLPMPGQTG